MDLLDYFSVGFQISGGKKTDVLPVTVLFTFKFQFWMQTKKKMELFVDDTVKVCRDILDRK